MSLPECSDGIEEGTEYILAFIYSLDPFISFFYYMLICLLYVLSLYYSSLSTSILSPMMHKTLLTPPYGEQMATFSQKSVMGTIFETTERLEQLKPVIHYIMYAKTIWNQLYGLEACRAWSIWGCLVLLPCLGTDHDPLKLIITSRIALQEISLFIALSPWRNSRNHSRHPLLQDTCFEK